MRMFVSAAVMLTAVSVAGCERSPVQPEGVSTAGLSAQSSAASAAAMGKPEAEASYANGVTVYMIGPKLIPNARATMPNAYAHAEELYLTVYPQQVPPSPGAGPITLPSGYQPQCNPCFHPGLPAPFVYHDHVLTGAPGMGNHGTAGEFKAPWKIIVLVYDPAYVASSDFTPLTSEAAIDAAEQAGNVFQQINPGGENPYEIDTGNLLICPCQITHELRYAWRGLRRAPGFTVAAVLTLVLGIGANTALFSVVYGVALRPLDYRDADRLVAFKVERTFAGRPAPVPGNFSVVDLPIWQGTGQTFQSVAMSAGGNALLAGPGGNEVVSVATVTSSFFSTLDGRLTLGRGLTDADDATPSAVVSHRLWQRLFPGASALDGAQVVLDGQPYAVVGVADDSFEIPNARIDVWRPVGFTRTLVPWMARPRAGGFQVFARLRPAASFAQAQADTDVVSRAVDSNLRSTVIPLRDQFLPASARPTLLMLWGAVALLLIVSCVNVTNLILTRDTGRARELAVCLALGASRRRLVAQSTGQSVLLAAGGMIGGTALGAAILDALRAFGPSAIPRLEFVRLDAPVLAFTCLVAFTVALVVGAMTASPRVDAATALRSSSAASSEGRRGRRLRQRLVAAEVAVSMVLLVGAGLVGRTLADLLRVDLGVTNRQVMTALVDVSFGRSLSVSEQRSTIERIVDRVGQLPGVVSIGAGASLPPNLSRLRFTLDRFDDAIGQPVNYMVDAVSATPGYFSTLGTRLREGRVFTDSDDALHPQVAVVTASTARQLFGDRRALGRVVHLPLVTDNGPGNGPVTIVGVIDDVRYSGLDVAPNGVIFRPFAQQPWASMFIVARTEERSASFAAAMRRAISSADPGAAIHSIDSLESLVTASVAQPTFRATSLGALAFVAVALAGLGLYGVVSFAVSQRRREIGIRMALGATRVDLLSLVFRETVWLAGAGIAAGGVAALGLARTLRTLLYGVAPGDPWSFMGASVALLGVAALASYLPMRKATRIDPIAALRAE